MRARTAFRRQLAAGILGTAALAAHGPGPLAQPYPNRPVRVIVPFAPGGAVDLVGRTMAQALSQALGQSFVAENRPGVGGLVALELVARAPPDGYTLAVGSAGPLTVSPSLYPDHGFEPLKALDPVILFANTPGVIVARADLPARSAGELLALSRTAPVPITMASAGSGSILHLMGEYFQSRNDVKWTHIPYKGSSPALTDMVAGRVDIMFDVVPSTVPYVRAGKLKAIAVTSRARAAQLPETPTLGEAGLPGYDMGSWMGLLAPKNTPPEVLARLNAELARVLGSGEMQGRLAGMGAVPEGGSPGALARRIEIELPRWAEVIRSAAVRAD